MVWRVSKEQGRPLTQLLVGKKGALPLSPHPPEGHCVLRGQPGLPYNKKAQGIFQKENSQLDNSGRSEGLSCVIELGEKSHFAVFRFSIEVHGMPEYSCLLRPTPLLPV